MTPPGRRPLQRQLTPLSRVIRTAGLSEDSVASTLGVAKQTIYHWGRGSYVPHLSHVVRLSQILNCSIDQLVSILYDCKCDLPPRHQGST